MKGNKHVIWMVDAIGEEQKVIVLSNVPDEDIKEVASDVIRWQFDKGNKSYQYHNVGIYKVSEEIHFEEDELKKLYKEQLNK